MAKKTIVTLIDDIDGKEIADNGQTLAFSFRATSYEIDLSERNAKKLATTLSPYIAAARTVGGRRAPSTNVGADRSQSAAMREWATSHGYNVSKRGRIGQEIQDAFHNASK